MLATLEASTSLMTTLASSRRGSRTSMQARRRCARRRNTETSEFDIKSHSTAECAWGDFCQSPRSGQTRFTQQCGNANQQIQAEKSKGVTATTLAEPAR